MASVFLSYDRDDLSRARRIAQSLEKAGHSVWWDRRIKSGAQYSREIDEALKRADAVVVLWSEKSIDSAWVRDEAASGRDAGKLVPARIDPVDPPLGFRQYQTTELTRSTGRGRSSQFQEMLEAIAALSEGEAAAPAPPPAHITRGTPGRPLILVAVAVVALIAVGLLAWNLIGRPSSVPVVAVAPADPSPESRALARDLFVKLGTLQTARPNSIDLVSNEEPSKKPVLTLQVGGSGHGQGAEANLALTGGRNGALLWAKDVRDPNGNKADLRQQLAYTAARVLDCALDGLHPVGDRLGREALKTYLNACSIEGASAEVAALISPLRQLVQQAPEFAGGWAQLLLAEIMVMTDPGRPDGSALRPALARHIVEARRAHPDLAEAYIAEFMLTPEAQFLERSRLLDRAIERNPDSAELRGTRAMFLGYVGRLDDALADVSRAAQLNPLSPAMRDNYIASLTFAGRMDEALSELREAKQLWPGSTSVQRASFRLHLRVGDPREALKLLHAGALKGSPAHWVRLNEALLEARIDRSPQNIDRAIQEARMAYNREPRAIYGLAQTLVEFDREAELFKILLNWRRMDIVTYVTEALLRPGFSDFHKDPRFMQVAKRLGLLDFWRTTGKWPDLCFKTDLPYDCKTEAAKLTA